MNQPPTLRACLVAAAASAALLTTGGAFSAAGAAPVSSVTHVVQRAQAPVSITFTWASPAARVAKLAATLAYDDATTAGSPQGTVYFIDSSTDMPVAQDETNTDGRAAARVTLPPGHHDVEAYFTPDDSSTTGYASTSKTVVVKAPAHIAETIVRRTAPGAHARGVVSVTLRDVQPTPVATGKVVVRQGARVLLTHALSSSGKARVRLPLLAKGRHDLVVVWRGDRNGARTSRDLVVVQR